MKIILSLIVSSALGLVVTVSAAVKSGDLAPNFTLTDTTGSELSLSDFVGKYVVLEWTNHKCPFVVKHYKHGHMQAMQQSMTSEGVIWLQIVSSAEGKQGYVTASEAEQIRVTKNMHSTSMLLDIFGEVGRMFDARTTPHIYLIDPKGVVIYQGAIDSIRSTRSSDIEKAKNFLHLAYRSALAGESVEHSTTTAYGCGIKY